MYTLQKAAAILGISICTLRRWLKRYNMKTRILETDRRRAYLSRNDIDKLILGCVLKVEESDRKKRRNRLDKSKSPLEREIIYFQENPEEKLYSMIDAASLLGVAVETLKRWIAQDQIEKIRIYADRRRVYLSHDSVLVLADLHKRTTPKEQNAGVTENGEANDMQNNTEKKIYSLVQAALFLGVSRNTVRSWVLQDKIEMTTISTDRRRIYLSHDSVLMLAELHKREVVLSSANIFEEVKEMKKKINAIIKDIEDVKHDLRIIVKTIFIYE